MESTKKIQVREQLHAVRWQISNDLILSISTVLQALPFLRGFTPLEDSCFCWYFGGRSQLPPCFTPQRVQHSHRRVSLPTHGWATSVAPPNGARPRACLLRLFFHRLSQPISPSVGLQAPKHPTVRRLQAAPHTHSPPWGPSPSAGVPPSPAPPGPCLLPAAPGPHKAGRRRRP